MTALDSDSLSKVYAHGPGRARVQALQDFSISVAQGEIFSLLGPNGAGKTTFLKIVLSLAHPTSGQASILGRRIPDKGIKSRLGYLPENHRYPAYLTGEQVLWFFGQLSGVRRPILASRIPRLLELVGIAQWKGVKVKRYSKGMMQRLGLAQAMVNDPDVLFLDEPTDGVDPLGRKEIRDVLHALKGQGKTIFLNSHLLSEVELVSDRVAILDKGKLLKIGTIDELTSGGHRYTIGIVGTIPPDAVREAEARALKFSGTGDAVSIDADSISDLNIVIDLLRRNGVEITSVARQRTTLEESFISLIKPGGHA